MTQQWEEKVQTISKKSIPPDSIFNDSPKKEQHHITTNPNQAGFPKASQRYHPTNKKHKQKGISLRYLSASRTKNGIQKKFSNHLPFL